jgi:hypothetical protein
LVTADSAHSEGCLRKTEGRGRREEEGPRGRREERKERTAEKEQGG